MGARGTVEREEFKNTFGSPHWGGGESKKQRPSTSPRNRSQASGGCPVVGPSRMHELRSWDYQQPQVWPLHRLVLRTYVWGMAEKGLLALAASLGTPTAVSGSRDRRRSADPLLCHARSCRRLSRAPSRSSFTMACSMQIVSRLELEDCHDMPTT